MKQTTDPRTLSTAAAGAVLVPRRDVSVDGIDIPDLWHPAQGIPDPGRAAILAVWHLAHDLRNKLTTMAAPEGVDILGDIERFHEDCAREQYTDSGTAWEILGNIHAALGGDPAALATDPNLSPPCDCGRAENVSGADHAPGCAVFEEPQAPPLANPVTPCGNADMISGAGPCDRPELHDGDHWNADDQWPNENP